jgi:hypothetical protein
MLRTNTDKFLENLFFTVGILLISFFLSKLINIDASCFYRLVDVGVLIPIVAGVSRRLAPPNLIALIEEQSGYLRVSEAN